MIDRREEILLQQDSYDAGKWLFARDKAINAMDEYFTERSLELLDYVVKHTTGHSIDEQGNVEFKYKGEWITKQALFENFL